MPEFGDLLTNAVKFELAVQRTTPRKLAQGFTAWARGEYDRAEVERLKGTLFQLVVKYHGPLGASEFIQEVEKRLR